MIHHMQHIQLMYQELTLSAHSFWRKPVQGRRTDFAIISDGVAYQLIGGACVHTHRRRLGNQNDSRVEILARVGSMAVH